MRYVGDSEKTAQAVTEALQNLGTERVTSWASSRSWDPNRLYCQVSDSTFETNIGGGTALTSILCSGVIRDKDQGCSIDLNVRYGILPAWSMRAPLGALVLGFGAALSIWLAGYPWQMIAISSTACLVAVVYLWHKAESARYIRSQLAEAVGGIKWRRAGSAV